MITALYEKFLTSTGISTDTRKIRKGSLFFALKGPNFNANKFAAQALEKGVAFAVVDDPAYSQGENCILVEDVLTTLQNLASLHRRKLKIPFIAITGSNGKTTTKELLHAVLSKKFKTSATRGNLNNHIGVPLTILDIKKETEMAIIEMGANHIGEIAALCEIAEPNYGMITNIGKAHTEGFGGFDGVIRAKSELYHYLIQHGGDVFINSTNEILFNMSKRFAKPFLYPQKEDFYHCEFQGADPFVKYTDEKNEPITTQLIGKYNFENIAAALCVGKFFGVPGTLANEAVANYLPENNRSQVIKKGTNTILLDAYNANPSSMESALENLSLMQAENKAVMLGDMFELGEQSEEEHEKLGQLVAKYGFNPVFLCGKNIEVATKHLSEAKHFETREELVEHLNSVNLQNTTILIKASRGIGLEKVVEVI